MKNNFVIFQMICFEVQLVSTSDNNIKPTKFFIL